ncbi:glycosyl hydrolases family 31-domain-containing protein [Cladochytrium replicatum]|nr:glycosyl hydrolases family 31-domain-containing protein [Cladochytrium replicatum]
MRAGGPVKGNFLLLISLLLLFLIPSVATVKQEDFKLCHQSGFCKRQRAYAEYVQRKGLTGKSPYSLQEDSLKVNLDAGEIAAVIRDAERNVDYTLQIDLLTFPTAPGGVLGGVSAEGSSGARVRIKEAAPLKPRYEQAAEFAIVAEELSRALAGSANASFAGRTAAAGGSAVDSSEGSVHVVFGKDKKYGLFINSSPFRFEFSVDHVQLVSFNERGYFYYEHLRKKEEAVQAIADQEQGEEAVAVDGNKADGTVETDPDLETLRKDITSEMWEESFNGKQDSKPNGPSSIGIDLTFPGSDHLYGIPEHASDFSLKTTRGEGAAYSEPYRLYNFDVFEYILDSPMALYGSIPLIISKKKDYSVGVLWINSAEMWVDVEKSSKDSKPSSGYIPFAISAKSSHIHASAESGIVDLFFFLGPTPQDVVQQHTVLTGMPAMPQLFATAYHQCRWNYNDEADVLDVDANFDKYDIPYDVLWLDIEHTDSKKYFTWDKAKFPDPVKMQQSLASRGRKMVTIVDPHIKVDSGYAVYQEAKEQGLFVKNKDNNDFDGWCWPGSSSWLDYTNPAARKYWADRFSFEKYQDTTASLYIWNDMNEPSVFTGPEITMPKDNLHFGGVEHREVHNMYGMLQQQSTFEGLLQRGKHNDRPFVLSRAFFIGTQRFGAVWTGDNYAKWDHLGASVPMLLSMGVSGMPFVGADVGGFFENPEPELLVRWYQTAAFQPFYRGHAHIDTKRREPWLFGDEVTGLIREAIRHRYRIMPFLYTLFFEAHALGIPAMRPMMYEFADDEKLWGMDDQFMLGSALLVKPVTSKDVASVIVTLPKSSVWYDYETFERVKPSAESVEVQTPLSKTPVFLRGGNILSRRDRFRRSATLAQRDPITLVVALDKNGEAQGKIYLDDGRSYAHESGEYILSSLTFKDGRLSGRDVRWRPLVGSAAAKAKASGPGSSGRVNNLGVRVERIVVLGLKGLKQSGVKARITGSKDQLEVTVMDKIVTIKDPKVLVGKDWDVDVVVG